ncbi:Uncharacterised protein [Providencia rettgeri]|nr:hypothetical protein [Providencia rettgeri]CAB5594956.1 Uncharacterised protein [Providencia rettgeri]CAC9155285.1 Uncharacterised protein [Providencia rettgeri]
MNNTLKIECKKHSIFRIKKLHLLITLAKSQTRLSNLHKQGAFFIDKIFSQ